jgi:hypothetical protein
MFIVELEPAAPLWAVDDDEDGVVNARGWESNTADISAHSSSWMV